MVTLNQSLMNLYAKRFITFEQAVANSTEPDELKVMFERAGLTNRVSQPGIGKDR